MPLQFTDEVLGDLAGLSDLSPDLVAEFCSLSLQFQRHGATKKRFVKAAKNLAAANAAAADGAAAAAASFAPEDVERLVAGLSHVLAQAALHRTTRANLALCLLDLALPAAQLGALLGWYDAHVADVRAVAEQSVVAHVATSREHYADLKWRLDVEIGRRTARKGLANPTFLLELRTRGGATGGAAAENKHLLQADYANLKMLQQELNRALAEAKSTHSVRVQRYLR